MLSLDSIRHSYNLCLLKDVNHSVLNLSERLQQHPLILLLHFLLLLLRGICACASFLDDSFRVLFLLAKRESLALWHWRVKRRLHGVISFRWILFIAV